MSFTEREITEGRALLARKLTEIKMRHDPRALGTVQAGTHVGNSVLENIRLDNLHALIIRRSRGGWHADILLRDMPAGVSNVMGTPEHMPLARREDALEAGTAILEQIYKICLENESAYHDVKPGQTRYFEIHGYALGLPAKAIDELAERMPPGNDNDEVIQELRKALSELLQPCIVDDSLDTEKFTNLEDARKTSIVSVVASLMAFNDFRYPPTQWAERLPDPDDASPC